MGRRKRGSNPYRGDKLTERAREEGYAARSVYKLQELQKRFRLLRGGQRVVDLGCSPGSWWRYAAQVVGPGGVVVGVDIHEPEVRPGPWLHASVLELSADDLRQALGGDADVVLSDMAPRTTGDPFGDHVRQIELARRALSHAVACLRAGGAFVAKVFDGEDAPAFVDEVRGAFATVKRARPEAVRSRSREFFVVATGFTPREPRPAPEEEPAPPPR